MNKRFLLRIAGLGLIGVALFTGLTGAWQIIAGLAGVALFLFAGPT